MLVWYLLVTPGLIAFVQHWTDEWSDRRSGIKVTPFLEYPVDLAQGQQGLDRRMSFET